ncbi:hypothetical protein MMC17_006670 [Xylographa soralifera]|nr:hypothetical protein [Xylographa soralifera]
MRAPRDLRDIKVDLDMDDTDSRSPPQSPFNKSTFRKLRRLLRHANRRHLAILSIFAFLVFLTFRSTKSIVSSSSWSSSGIFACPSTRPLSTAITLPPTPPTAPLSQTWDILRSIYDAHPPKPSYMPHPVHESDLGFPTHEMLKDMVNITETDAYASRIEHESVVRHLPPYPEALFQGRGIVMLAGGKYSEFAATALGMLREVGSQLPVEVWMKNRAEEKEGWCEELEKEGMVCKRLQDYMDMSMLSHPYQWKIFTIVFSSFQEVIFLDADDIPIRNPDVIFDSAIYRDKGAILWPDYWKHTGSPWLPYIIGINDEASDMLQEEKSAESGQLVWDKERHWKSLCLAAYYNYYGPQYYFTLINSGWAGWGDKDTFPTALKALDEPYHQVSQEIVTVFISGTVRGIGMVQADPTNETNSKPMFLHSNIVKWSMRDFLCVGCSALDGSTGMISHIEDPSSPINSHMLEGKRVFSTDQLPDIGMDAEPLIWEVMESLACRSVWGNKQVCQQARDHMTRTFGYQFKSSWIASLLGYGDRVCATRP